jgi:hypothetical protein
MSVWDDTNDVQGEINGETLAMQGLDGPRDADMEDSTQQPTITHQDEVPAAENGEVIETRSRSSSISRDGSDPGIERQDSPITSIDEDSKLRPQQSAARKASGKVQELVYKFDGLAKAAVTEPVVQKRDRQEILRRRAAGQDDEDDDTEDFDDLDEPELNETPSPPVASDSIPTMRLGEFSPWVESQETAISAPKPSVPVTANIEALISKFGPVSFSADLDKVGSLFGEAKVNDIGTRSDQDEYISDRIVSDSFGDISERKAWYRISRQGSSRKYNAGDDDSYCRVAWSTSNTRLETLQIVRRWMEEDSITGRPTLGGGSTKKGNMFGWDSEGEAVTLDKVFGKKIQPQPIMSSFQQQFQPANATGTQQLSAATAQSMPLVPSAAPVASFGWSTTDTPSSSSNIAAQETSFGWNNVDTSVPASNTTAPVPSFGWNTVDTSGSAPTATASQEARNLRPAPPERSKANTTPSIPLAPPAAAPIVPPVASFGWDTVDTSTLVSKSAASQETRDLHPTPLHDTLSLSTPMSGSTHTPLNVIDEEADDEDEWGDMISSPSDTKQPLVSNNDAFGYIDTAMSPPLTQTSHAEMGSRLLSSEQFSPDALMHPTSDIISPTTGMNINQTNSGPDAWSSMDFSFFDTPAQTNPQIAVRKPSVFVDDNTMAVSNPIPSPLKMASLMPTSNTTTLFSDNLSTGTFTPTTPIPISSPVPITLPLRLSTEMEVDAGDSTTTTSLGDPMAKQIIANLPDLGYMLR